MAQVPVSVILNVPDGSLGGATGPAGPKGDVGPQGVQGPAGPRGMQGLMGPTGPQGLAGPQGLQGLNAVPSGAAGVMVPWTPQIIGSAGDPMQYSSQQGFAWKTGRLVHFQAYTQFSAWGTTPMTGNLMLAGLPWPTAMLPVFASADVWYTSNLAPSANPITSIFVYTGGGQSQWAFYGRVAGENPRPVTCADLNFHTQLMISGSYLVD